MDQFDMHGRNYELSQSPLLCVEENSAFAKEM